MMKLALKDHVVQMGYLERDAQEVINLIKSYDMPSDFFEWLSKGTCTMHVIQENTYQSKYTRIAQYSLDNIPLFTGRIEFELNKLSKEAIKFLVKEKTPIGNNTPQFLNLRKHRFSHTCTELHYTVVSKLYKQDEIVGSAWEIFELPGLVELYNKMEDPLRPWRNDYL